MNKVFSTLLLLCLVCASSSCKEDDETKPDEKIAPTNLVVNSSISTDGSGVVNFTATATDAVRYYFSFGEFSTLPGVVTADGDTTYTYSNSGTYNVKVIAFSEDELSITKTVTVVVQVDEPPVTATGYTSSKSYDGMTMVWNDEFNGESLNSDFWTHEIGNGSNGWGNNELEYYKSDNTIVHDGYLTIKAKKETVGAFSYTSSRIVTKDKKKFTYGRVDVRALLPKGQGIWPALWMLGNNISEVGFGWPKCGEIDIMEMIGGGPGRDDKLYGTAHYDNGGYKSNGGNTTLTGGKIFADEFHVFSIVWTETYIKWYLDDVEYHSLDITPTSFDEFHKDFFFIFNVAVGGNWPGPPDPNTTVFPQRMIVDYIRVFQPE